VPEEGTRWLAPLTPSFSYRHYLVFCWVLVAPRRCVGKATVQGLARDTPTHVAAWPRRRLLAAGRWQGARGLEGRVSETLAACPPPKDGALSLGVDRTLKGNRSKKTPWAKKGRLHEYVPFTCGLHVVLLMAQWEVDRVPRALRLGTPTGSPGSQSEKARRRELFQEVRLPPGCKKGGVVADAASPSRANLQALQARGGCFVIAFPRPWKVVNGQYLRDIVTHLPLPHDPQVRVPLLVPPARRRVCWTVAQRAEWRQGGEVSVGLSRRRRHESPKHTTLLVTTLPQAPAHLTVALYLRRWPVALCSKEGKGVVGLGQHHVTKEAARVQRSGAVAVLAYLRLLRLRAKQSKPGRSWSAFTLKQELAWDWGTRHLHRTARQQARKEVRLQLAPKEAPMRLAA
jgi:hypothetical protein